MPLRNLLRRPGHPTALIGCPQTVALDVLDICRTEGIDVPGRVSVIGVGGSFPPIDRNPTLTVIDQGRLDQIAELAVDLLANPAHTRRPVGIRLTPRLIERCSTAGLRDNG